MEFGLGRTGMSYDVDQESGAQYGGYGVAPGIRHQALWIKSNSLGTLWMGHTTDAVDGLIDVCLGCPITSSSESSLGWGSFVAGIDGLYSGDTWSALGVGQEGYYATRRNLLKYVSPTIAGFSLSASWGDNDDGDATAGTTGAEHDYTWNVALRYAGEFNSIRVDGAAGYTSDEGAEVESWAVAGSIQHVPSGLYVHANYREQDLTTGGVDEAWAVQVGVAQKWSSLGKTTFWVQYAEHDNQDKAGYDWVDGQVLSFGINQKIDAAAMELYITYWNVGADAGIDNGPTTEYDDLDVIMAGARIQF
jgi:predicted porin